MPQLSPLPAVLNTPNQPQTPGTPAASSSGFSFHDLLSIVNPLQHLPVIGTLYRAITGDTIGTPEKIAGDTLYGGLWGAVASVADAAFQALTGKDVGDTVLAMFTGNHDSKPAAVAANTAAAPATATPANPATPDANISALPLRWRKKAWTTTSPSAPLPPIREALRCPALRSPPRSKLYCLTWI